MSSKRRIPPGWIPNQHGAWAMLTVPFLVGALRAGPQWLHLGLLAFWMVGYFGFFAAGLWLRSARRPRLRRPVWVYAVAAALLGLPVALIRPDLLWWVPVYLPVALVSLGFSWRRQERALTNDGLTILAACLVGLVAYQVGAGTLPWDGGSGWVAMAWATLALFGYFFGTSLYVKTLIRERTNLRYHRWSVGYHAVLAVGWLVAWRAGLAPESPAHPWLVAFFIVLTARAAILAGRRIRPLHVGLGEIVASAVILALTVWF